MKKNKRNSTNNQKSGKRNQPFCQLNFLVIRFFSRENRANIYELLTDTEFRIFVVFLFYFLIATIGTYLLANLKGALIVGSISFVPLGIFLLHQIFD